MRCNIEEIGQRRSNVAPESLKGTARTGALKTRRTDALHALAVDAALEDETVAPQPDAGAPQGRRRVLEGFESHDDRRIIDQPHKIAADEDAAGLIRRLALQLSSLQAQQEQISQLLEQAEIASAAIGASRS